MYANKVKEFGSCGGCPSEPMAVTGVMSKREAMDTLVSEHPVGSIERNMVQIDEQLVRAYHAADQLESRIRSILSSTPPKPCADSQSVPPVECEMAGHLASVSEQVSRIASMLESLNARVQL